MDKQIADHFNSVFSNIGPQLADQIEDPHEDFVPPVIRAGATPLYLPSITVDYVTKSIKTLPVHKAMGIVGISTRLLKSSIDIIAPVLTYIYVIGHLL